jgi:hypothetical protein
MGIIDPLLVYFFIYVPSFIYYLPLEAGIKTNCHDHQSTPNPLTHTHFLRYTENG